MKYRKLKNIYKLAFRIMFIFTLILAITPFTYKTEAVENKNKIILIDPGHGGIDGGAVSKNGTVEKDINLSISKFLKENLEKEGYEVHVTRDEDKGLYEDKGTVREKKNQDLNNRCIMKGNTKCDMFLSIHLNMFPQIKYSGAQVWYSNYEKSKDFAKILQDTLKEELNPNNNRKEKAAEDAYKILRDGYKAPCVIVECGFLSNIEEEAKLKTSEYQESIAKAITKAVNRYYDN